SEFSAVGNAGNASWHERRGRYAARENWRGENGFGRATDERKSLLHMQNASADSSGQAGEVSDLWHDLDQERRAEMTRRFFLALMLPLFPLGRYLGQTSKWRLRKRCSICS